MKNNLPASKLLSLVVNFYGHLGLQLHSISSTVKDSRFYFISTAHLRLLLNIALNIEVAYTSFRLDPYLSKGYPIDPAIPWHVVAAFDTFYLYPINHILFSLYYLFFGRRIVHLLSSSPHLVKIYQKSEEGLKLKWAVVLGLFILHHFLFCTIFSQVISYYPLSFSSALCILYDYLNFSNPSLTLALLYYGQHGTYQSLVSLLQSLQNSKASTQLFQNAEEELRQIARFSSELYLLLSAPLALFIFAVIFDAIACLCIGQAVPNWQTIVNCAVSLGYLLYLIHLNAAIRGILIRISDRLCDTRRLQNDLDGSVSPESLQIRLQETVSVYGPYYTLRLFQFSNSSTIDYQFFFHSILLIFNYSTLIIQTGPEWSFANITDISVVTTEA